MTAQPARDQLSRRAGHILFTQGPEQPAATARETCVLLDDLAAAEKRAAEAEARIKAVDAELLYADLHGNDQVWTHAIRRALDSDA